MGRGVSGEIGREGRMGLTFTVGTPAYHHYLVVVVHVRAQFAGTRRISSERATLKGHGAAASAVNINCPSPGGSSIVNKRNQDKVGDGVLHPQPSTSMSISTSDR